jgi:murein DD-endopeptidase MepM/ murein hydrolase activator NlpD
MTDIGEPPVPSDMPALQWPVPDARYIAEAFTGLYSHNALDIAADGGSSITADADGTVIKAVYSTSGYGNYLLLDHGSGVTTLYAHCQELLVAMNDTVKAGDVIARVGSTGNSTGNHCHFEVRINNTQTDPQRFMTAPAEPAA